MFPVFHLFTVLEIMSEIDPYKIDCIYRKRLMNAKGYVMFWEEHVKKLPDAFATSMLEVSKKILLKTEKEIDKLRNEQSE